MKPRRSLAGVQSPPLRGGPSPWYPALRDEAPKMRGKWFSRRDALCAPACQGRTQAETSHSHRCVYDEPVGNRRRRSGWRFAFLPGVRSPPLRGASRAGMALRGKPWHNAKGGFLGGAHSVRPPGKATRMPRHSIPTGWVDDKPVAKRAHAPVKPVPFLRACGARPSAGGKPSRDGLAGKTLA